MGWSGKGAGSGAMSGASMGAAAGPIGAGAGLVGGALLGGLFGGEDPTMKVAGDTALDTMIGKSEYWRDPAAMQALGAYGMGKGSSADVLGRANTMMEDKSGQDARRGLGLQEALATGPITGSRFATEQVQNNPILGQLFGDKGLFGKEISTEQDLQNQGYQLKPEDTEAYGQASGNIARSFGAQGSSLAQALAERGLGGTNSGAAGLGFSGLAGNKNEQLAKAQTDIANARMENTQKRIAQQQQFIGQLGSQGASAIQDQFGRQLSGVAQTNKDLQAQSAALQTSQGASQNADQFNAEHKSPGAMEMLQGMGSQAGGAFGKGAGQAGATGIFGGGAAPVK